MRNCNKFCFIPCCPGPPGPIGRTGPTGPTGTAEDVMLAGVQYQLKSGEAFSLPIGNPIIFDTLIASNSPDIIYNITNGQFTLAENGLYFVDWSISNGGAGPETVVSAGIEIVGVQTIENSGTVQTPQLTGSAVVIVNAAPQVIRLINTSGFEMFVDQTPIQANLSIIHLTTA